MAEAPSDLNLRIAERVRELRSKRGLSLDALAKTSGVSRSMISLIERGESSPTAVVLEKIARGLRATLPALFDAPAAARCVRPSCRAARDLVGKDRRRLDGKCGGACSAARSTAGVGRAVH